MHDMPWFVVSVSLNMAWESMAESQHADLRFLDIQQTLMGDVHAACCVPPPCQIFAANILLSRERARKRFTLCFVAVVLGYGHATWTPR